MSSIGCGELNPEFISTIVAMTMIEVKQCCDNTVYTEIFARYTS